MICRVDLYTTVGYLFLHQRVPRPPGLPVKVADQVRGTGPLVLSQHTSLLSHIHHKSYEVSPGRRSNRPQGGNFIRAWKSTITVFVETCSLGLLLYYLSPLTNMDFTSHSIKWRAKKYILTLVYDPDNKKCSPKFKVNNSS